MDPFFAAQARHKGGNSLRWGKQPGYVEDIYRTYTKMPSRDPNTFERALQYREKELSQWADVKKSNEQLRSEKMKYEQMIDRTSRNLTSVTNQLKVMTEQYSKLKAEHGRANSDSVGGDSRGSLPSDAGSERGRRGKDSESGLASVPREVLRTDVPDSSGQASEHGSKERRVGRADTEGDVPIREESVPEGSE